MFEIFDFLILFENFLSKINTRFFQMQFKTFFIRNLFFRNWMPFKNWCCNIYICIHLDIQQTMNLSTSRAPPVPIGKYFQNHCVCACKRAALGLPSQSDNFMFDFWLQAQTLNLLATLFFWKEMQPQHHIYFKQKTLHLYFHCSNTYHEICASKPF